MRVLVCGGRDFFDGRLLKNTLCDLVWQRGQFKDTEKQVSTILHGGAQGADLMAADFAVGCGLEVVEYRAAWDDLETPPVVIRRRRDGKLYNAAAGGIRNQRMLDEGKPDLVVAFPGGRGTADMVKRARAAGVRVILVPSPDNVNKD